MGVVLTAGVGEDTVHMDYNILGAAIDLAVFRVLRDFNVDIEPILGLYGGGCLENGLAGLNQTIRVLETSVDLLLGPGCSGDLVMAGKLSTLYRVPVMTGAGSYVDMTDEWPYVVRTGFNTMTQWSFFLHICRRFGWTNVAVLYEADMNNTITLRSGQSKLHFFGYEGMRDVCHRDINGFWNRASVLRQMMVFN